jgi:class 3 adenylate cyclase
VSDGRYQDRIADLLRDAQDHAERLEWDAVRALATAALALAPGDASAEELLQAANRATPDVGERRQLTVMFCDVVGSTVLSQQRDPELVREVLRSYQATCDEVVRRYDGRIARYIGDGVLAYFGHPVAHEDDARRGVQAGLDLLQALEPVTKEVRERYDIDLSIRVAVHTGVVVRAEMGSAATPDRDAIVGETPNLAARLQDHAAPGTLVISDITHDLVRGWFLVRPLGVVPLRGIERDVNAFEVVEPTSTDTRVHAQVDLSPYVGRAHELEALNEAWAAVEDREARTVVLSGPPGVGKTRLADVLSRRARARDGAVAFASCSAFHAATVLHPVRRVVERAAGIDVRGDSQHALPRLWNALDAIGQADALPYFADLLGIPPEPWCPAPELDGAKLREELLSRLDRWVRAAAARRPLLMVIDDVQWADPTTLELLGRLINGKIPGLLLVLTARDDYSVPWTTPVQLTLDRLSAEDLADLARRLPEGRALTTADLARVIERSDGIPLFLEELLRTSALSTGDGGVGTRASVIPAGLRDLLLARFAAPGVDLRLAQLLSTIRGEAPLELVAALLGVEPSAAARQLEPMVDAGILVVADGGGAFQFRHQLLSDLAYDTQLQAGRHRAHGIVADALLSGAAGGTPDHAVLAHHLEQAGRFDAAVEALIAAAEAALGLGAFTEVSDLLGRALGLLPTVTSGRRDELEFAVLLLRGSTSASTMGYAAPQAIADFEACQRLLGDPSGDGYLDDDDDGEGTGAGLEQVWSHTGLWATFMLQGRLDDCDAVTLRTMSQLRPGGLLHSYFDASRSFVQFFRGDLLTARPAMQRSFDLLQEIELPRRLATPNDPRITTLAHLSMVAAFACQPAEARRLSDEGLALARTVPFPRGPFSVCYAASNRSAIELSIGDAEQARTFAAQNAELAERHGFTFWTLIAGLDRALAEFAAGDDTGGPRANMSISLLRALGVTVWLPSFLGTLAVIHLERGELDLAEGYLAEAADTAEATGAHYWSAEILRRQGELRMRRGDTSGLDLLRDAVDLAGRQGATLIELWCRSSLCRESGEEVDRKGLALLVESIPDDVELDDLTAARDLLASFG